MANSAPAPALKGPDGAAITIEMWPVDRPRPYPKNPRAITDKAISKVANSLKAFGFRQPIVVDKDGVVVVGHTRLLAAKRLGLLSVPVHVAADLSKKDIRSYRLADNKTGELVDWMDDMLAEEKAALAIDGVDLEPFGFEVEADAAGLGGDGGGDGAEKKPDACCPACGFEFNLPPKKKGKAAK